MMTRVQRRSVRACVCVLLVALSGCVDQTITGLRRLAPRPFILTTDAGVQLPLSSTPTAINSAGWVVGWMGVGEYLPPEAFLWKPGQSPQALGFQGAYGINSSGDVVGTGWGGRGLLGVLWKDGAIYQLGSLQPPFPDDGADGDYAAAINSSGDIVVNSHPFANGDHGGTLRPFLWKNGHIEELPTLGGDYSNGCAYYRPDLGRYFPLDHVQGSGIDTWAVAYSINDSDEIAGSACDSDNQIRAVIWRNGQIQDLGTLGGTQSRAFQINNAGQVVGSAERADGSVHAFLWENGSMRDLGALGTNSWGVAITSDGKVVGESGDLDELGSRTNVRLFLWTPTDGMMDLGNPNGSTWVVGVNDSLQLLIKGPVDGESFVYKINYTPTNTPAGSNVTVTPPDQTTGSPAPIELTFDEVTSAGATTVTSSIIGAEGTPPAPSGFALGSPATFYNITSQASFAGSVTLCIDYGAISYGNEAELRLLHYSNGTWTDITSPGYPETTTKSICGVTTSFSPFLIAESNVAPIVGSISLPLAPLTIGSLASVSATFSDPNPRDHHSSLVTWGDGTISPASITEATGSGTAAGTHSYATPGVYTVGVSISDETLTGSRTSSADVPSYIVAYNPSGGFVTGGGWITSPRGAYADDEALSGKATFGFVSKYVTGKTIPTGHTEFMFTAGQLKFTSNTYDWLVISGARAQYKGSGTINGGGSYRFLLTAIDGQQSGGGNIDRFRIKIWDDVSGRLVYDNEKGSADGSDPITALGGGSIVIQK